MIGTMHGLQRRAVMAVLVLALWAVALSQRAWALEVDDLELVRVARGSWFLVLEYFPMKIRSFIWRTLYAVVFLGIMAHSAEPSPNAAAIRELVGKLAITDAPAAPGPIYTPSKDTPRTDKRVIAYAAADELRKFGLEAFPFLLESMNDKRQSVAFRRALPSTVGDACFCLIVYQLYALPADYDGSFYRTGADGKGHERPVFLKSLFATESLKEWLAARQGRTLPELQLEGLGWVLAEEERIGASTPEAEAKYLAPLRAKLAELKKQIDDEQKK